MNYAPGAREMDRRRRRKLPFAAYSKAIAARSQQQSETSPTRPTLEEGSQRLLACIGISLLPILGECGQVGKDSKEGLPLKVRPPTLFMLS
jgi:hypothetical protein